MNRRTALVLLAFGVLAYGYAHPGGYSQAQAAPLAGTCGGQQWHAVAPIDCEKDQTIDGTTFHIHLVEEANGATTVTYSLDKPRSSDTLIHSISHQGNSDAGGPENEAQSVIAAGSDIPVSLHFQALCGQIDNRAVYDNKAGRIAGPYIINDTCSTPSSSSSVPPVSTSTTVPQRSSSTTTSPGPVSSPQSGPGTTAHPANLPATGSESRRTFGYAIAALVVGGGLVMVARRRPA